MSNEKKISLTFDLEEVSNDVLVKCKQISDSIRDEAMEDIKANVLEPDNPESRSIINRAVTEAFGKVKTFCQRYLKTGRTVDNNVLERMVSRVSYVTEQEKDSQGRLLYDCKENGVSHVVYQFGNSNIYKDDTTNEVVEPDETPTPRMVETGDISSMTYETISMDLYIPNFNVSVTDALKSDIHKYVVDWIMYRFLQDQLADKAGEYKTLADGEDHANITRDLNARESFKFRKPAWV